MSPAISYKTKKFILHRYSSSVQGRQQGNLSPYFKEYDICYSLPSTVLKVKWDLYGPKGKVRSIYVAICQ